MNYYQFDHSQPFALAKASRLGWMMGDRMWLGGVAKMVGLVVRVAGIREWG